jgi:hypothetical protein
MGNIKRIVPKAMRPANPRMTILDEEGFLHFAGTDNVACSFFRHS